MTKLALITSESIIRNKKGQKIPCVVLIGRDKNNKKRMWSVPFWPYFYILESDFIRLIDNKEVNFDLHVKETLGTGVRSLNRKALTKLVLYSGNDITSFTRFLIKYFKLIGEDPIFTYEADLSKAELLALRYMIDKGIKSGVDIREDGTIIPIELNCRLRKWFLDFESYKVRMCSSGPKKDVPLTMCTWYDNYEDTLYTYYVMNSKWEKLPVFKARYKNHIIKGFVSEGLFLDAIKDKVVQLDPDLFTAWNLDRYDVVKWFQRMKACNLDPALLSPFKSLAWKRKPYKIKGRILFDLMKAYKKFTNAELDSYSLAFMIGEEKFKLEKVLFKGSPAETWDKYPQVVFKRNVNDVLVLKQLDEKYELIEMFNDLRIEFGALFHETLIPHRIIDTALMRFVNKRIALSTSRKGKVDKSKFLGAVVIEPIPGKYKYVGQFDFCLDDKTEVLTRNGWLNIKEVSKLNNVLTYNIKTKKLEYQNPLAILEFPAKRREMIYIKNQHLDILSTSFHKTLYSLRRGKNKGKEKICFAKDIPTYISIPQARKFIGNEYLKEDLVKLAAWLISEGHFCKKSNALIIAQTEANKIYVEEIKALLKRLKFQFTDRTRLRKKYVEHEFYINAKYGKWIRENLVNEKRLNLKLLNLKPNLLKILLITLIKGDGTFAGNCLRYSTSDKILADQVQELALKLGYRNYISRKKGKYSGWMVNIVTNTGDAWVSSYKQDKRIVTLNQKVYCLTVPNSFFVARRNNKPFITGNSREYPNIIKTFNISPETYRRPDFKGNCYTIKYKDTIYKFIKKPLGLLPQLINSFFKKRDNYERKYKAAIKTDVTAKIKMFWRRIFNIKQITNAIYGVMDYPSFRLHRKECSAATAVVGRISIEKLQKIAAKHNRKIIYGDTDSIFVLLEGNTPEEALEDGEKLAQIFNDELSKYFTAEYNIPKAPSNLGLQKIYSKFLLMAKKLYAGKGMWDEKKGWKKFYDFKGIGIVRSDTSIMEKNVLKTLIKMVLSDKPAKELKEYWAKITKDFWNKIYTPFEIAYPLQIKKPIRYYGGKDKNGKPKTLPSHVRSALTSNKLLNTDFTAGDKPRRLPIISKKRIEVNVGKKTRTFLIKNISIAEDMVLPDKYILQVDWKRIYERLAKKVATIFELVIIQTSMEIYS